MKRPLDELGAFLVGDNMAAGQVIASLMATVGADLSGLTKGLGEASSKMAQAGQKMTSIGTKLSLGVTLPLVGIAGASLKTAADFERSGNKMQAISDATGEEMDNLRGKALQLVSYDRNRVRNVHESLIRPGPRRPGKE